MSSDEISRSQEDGITEWYRPTDEPDVRSISVSHEPDVVWPWHIGLTAAEFVREEPFETVFRQRIEQAIRSVSGITDVVEEDREVWLAKGDADGSVLAGAVADAVDEMAPQIREALEAD